MNYISTYASPVGEIKIIADETALKYLYFTDKNRINPSAEVNAVLRETQLIKAVKKWLDCYFNGEIPNVNFDLSPDGTEFQQLVWKELLKIPYGETVSYKSISQTVAVKLNKKAMSAQAVGGAVGRNPISIIIPCHRVIATNGNLTGYAGGIERKQYLLSLEKNK